MSSTSTHATRMPENNSFISPLAFRSLYEDTPITPGATGMCLSVCVRRQIVFTAALASSTLLCARSFATIKEFGASALNVQWLLRGVIPCYPELFYAREGKAIGHDTGYVEFSTRDCDLFGQDCGSSRRIAPKLVTDDCAVETVAGAQHANSGVNSEHIEERRRDIGNRRARNERTGDYVARSCDDAGNVLRKAELLLQNRCLVGLRRSMRISRALSENGNSLHATAFRTLKSRVVSPMPRASAAMASTASVGCLQRRRSVGDVITGTPQETELYVR